MLHSTLAPTLPGGLVHLPAGAHGYEVLRVMARHIAWPDDAMDVPLPWVVSVQQHVSADFSMLQTGTWRVTVQLTAPGKPLLSQLFTVVHTNCCQPCGDSRRCCKQDLPFPYKQDFCKSDGNAHTCVCGHGEKHATQHSTP